MTTTIVNAKADYLIKNMRRLFQDTGLGLLDWKCSFADYQFSDMSGRYQHTS